jgi:predicted amino acid-binding ACT domain protein
MAKLGDRMSREPERDYYPRYIGLAPRQARMASGKVYEILVIGRTAPGVAAKLSAVMADNKVNLYPSGGYYAHEPGKFVWTTFADLSASKAAIESVTADLETFDFVEKVESKKISDVVFDQYLFPVLAGNDSRVIVFRLQPLLAVERKLMDTFGSGGASIMFEEGKSYALATLREYDAMLPRASPELLLKNVVAGLRTTGWGLFTFDVSRLLIDGTAEVTIREPPIAVDPDFHDSPFTNGMVAGIIERICGERMSVKSSRYDGSKKMLTLTLISIESLLEHGTPSRIG